MCLCEFMCAPTQCCNAMHELEQVCCMFSRVTCFSVMIPKLMFVCRRMFHRMFHQTKPWQFCTLVFYKCTGSIRMCFHEFKLKKSCWTTQHPILPSQLNTFCWCKNKTVWTRKTTAWHIRFRAAMPWWSSSPAPPAPGDEGWRMGFILRKNVLFLREFMG